MSEWLAVEAIIRQRDKENTAASIAKLSFRSQSGEQYGDPQLKGHNQSVSNEVCVYFLLSTPKTLNKIHQILKQTKEICSIGI